MKYSLGFVWLLAAFTTVFSVIAHAQSVPTRVSLNRESTLTWKILDFGEVAVGSHRDTFVTIYSAGNLPTILDSAAFMTPSYVAFSHRDTIAPMTTDSIKVRFIPRSEGRLNDTLTGFFEGGIITMPVTGTGVLASAQAGSAYSERVKLCTPYPNPAHGTLFIPITGTHDQQVSIALIDVLGRMRCFSPSAPIIGSLIEISTSDLPEGSYSVLVRADKFESTTTVIIAQ